MGYVWGIVILFSILNIHEVDVHSLCCDLAIVCHQQAVISRYDLRHNTSVSRWVVLCQTFEHSPTLHLPVIGYVRYKGFG